MAATGLSREDVTAILKAAGKDLIQQNAPVKEQARMSPEEFEKQFNVFKATKEFVAKLRSENPDDALAALHELRDGINRQNVSMNQVLIQAAIEKALAPVMEQLQPVQSYITEQREAQLKVQFFKENPELAPHESIVTLVRQSLEAKGLPAEVNTVPKALKYLADESKKVIATLQQSTNTNGTTNANTNGRSAGAVKSTKMSQLSGGGQGGASSTAGRGHGAGGPSGMELFRK